MATQRREVAVLVSTFALAVALGVRAASPAFGVFVAVALVSSMWIGKRVGGRRRITQGLTGLLLFSGACAAVAFVGVLLVMLVFALGGGVGGPVD